MPVTRRSPVLGFGRWLRALGFQRAPSKRESPPPTGVTVIAPLVEGQSWCDAARSDPSIRTDDQANELCTRLGCSGSKAIAAILDALGPRVSPSGRFQLGYTLILPLLRFYTRTSTGWEINQRAIDVALSTITEIDRAVVLHLSATHFNFEGQDFARELGEDPRNLMWTKEGPLGSKAYFCTPVYGWTLADADAPVNRYRRAAFTAVLDTVGRLPAKVRARIKAFTFLGETHQLFSDLQGNGVSYDSKFIITDYSPAARSGFRIWLQNRFETVDSLNEVVGGSYISFDAIDPPSEDLKDQAGADRLQHLDEQAAGVLAIFGWAVDLDGPPPLIDIYVDGERKGTAVSDLSRLDVFQVRPDFKTPNVGYRYDLDFRSFLPGQHTLTVVARTGHGEPYLLGERSLIVLDPAGGPPRPALGNPPSSRGITASVIGVLDRPASDIRLIYNPLARLWMEYRGAQVAEFQASFAHLAHESGIPSNALYTHQIAPTLYPDYNPDKLSVNKSLARNAAYQPGITMYGGSAFGEHFFRMREDLGWTKYGLAEFHPLVALSPRAYVDMFDRHNRAGAAYIAPYYLSTRVQALESELTKRLISPDNAQQGSRELYAAITSLMHTG